METIAENGWQSSAEDPTSGGIGARGGAGAAEIDERAPAWKPR